MYFLSRVWESSIIRGLVCRICNFLNRVSDDFYARIISTYCMYEIAKMRYFEAVFFFEDTKYSVCRMKMHVWIMALGVCFVIDEIYNYCHWCGNAPAVFLSFVQNIRRFLDGWLWTVPYRFNLFNFEEPIPRRCTVTRWWDFTETPRRMTSKLFRFSFPYQRWMRLHCAISCR